jgi:hypothetical protein
LLLSLLKDPGFGRFELPQSLKLLNYLRALRDFAVQMFIVFDFSSTSLSTGIGG